MPTMWRARSSLFSCARGLAIQFMRVITTLWPVSLLFPAMFLLLVLLFSSIFFWQQSRTAMNRGVTSVSAPFPHKPWGVMSNWALGAHDCTWMPSVIAIARPRGTRSFISTYSFRVFHQKKKTINWYRTNESIFIHEKICQEENVIPDDPGRISRTKFSNILN